MSNIALWIIHFQRIFSHYVKNLIYLSNELVNFVKTPENCDDWLKHFGHTIQNVCLTSGHPDKGVCSMLDTAVTDVDNTNQPEEQQNGKNPGVM